MSLPLCGIETIDTCYALVCDHLCNLPIVLCQLIRDYLNEYQTVNGDRRKELWDCVKGAVNYVNVNFNEPILYADPMISLEPNYNDTCYFIVRFTDRRPWERLEYEKHFGVPITAAQFEQYSVRIIQPKNTGKYNVELHWHTTWWYDLYATGDRKLSEKIRKFQNTTA